VINSRLNHNCNFSKESGVMALATVTEFLDQVSTDAALQAELSKALEAENDREAVTALAQSRGYQFSSEELWAEVQNRQTEFQQRQEAGELSDEELEAVAGGITPTIAVSITVSAGVLSIGGGLAVPQIKW
jgi:predicted ribosomally synthesized peptide with nif11-like leader